MSLVVPLVVGLLATVAAAEESAGSVTAAKPVARFEPTWESLERYEVPQWCLDGKFGIFIHWGVYSVPTFGNEWYPRNMYLQDSAEFKHHLATYGPQTKFGYKDFIPQFKAEKFGPSHWAEVFGKAGAKFVVPVAEHHDGFAMYDCSLSRWCAAKIGPKRDIIGELAAALPPTATCSMRPCWPGPREATSPSARWPRVRSCAVARSRT